MFLFDSDAITWMSKVLSQLKHCKNQIYEGFVLLLNHFSDLQVV